MLLLTPTPTPRIRYAAEVLWVHTLGQAITITTPAELGPNNLPSLWYGPTPPPSQWAHLPWIWAEGLLSETCVRDHCPKPTAAGRWFAVPESTWPQPLLEFDPLAAAFFIATEYHAYLPHWPQDAHGRTKVTNTPMAQLWAEPWLGLWAAELYTALLAAGLALPRLPSAPKPTWHLTLDIDHPWQFRYQPHWRTAAGCLREGLRGKWTAAAWRAQVAWGRKPDPYDTFDWLRSRFGPERLMAFVLLSNQHPRDSRFAPQHPALAPILRQWRARGYVLGLHPSYDSTQVPGRLAAEAQLFAQLMGSAPKHSRQHYLRWQLPQTPRLLIQQGIEHDYSACWADAVGFPLGATMPIPWFDLLANEPTLLWRHPTHAMDRALQRLTGNNPALAPQLLEGLQQKAQSVGGTLRLLTHNNTWSQAPAPLNEWAGWADALTHFLN